MLRPPPTPPLLRLEETRLAMISVPRTIFWAAVGNEQQQKWR
jgi:hypothetical protein